MEGHLLILSENRLCLVHIGNRMHVTLSGAEEHYFLDETKDAVVVEGGLSDFVNIDSAFAGLDNSLWLGRA